MTTLADRPNSALLIVDVQRDVVAGTHNRDEMIANINTLVQRAREADAPVIWVQHSDEGLVADSDGWQLVEELHPAADEPIVHKHFGDSFEETDLESLLAAGGIGHLVVAGAQTDACIRSTLHGALVRGYDATLVGDAHTTEDPRPYGIDVAPEQIVAHTNAYWNYTSAPGRLGGTVATAEVSF